MGDWCEREARQWTTHLAWFLHRSIDLHSNYELRKCTTIEHQPILENELHRKIYSSASRWLIPVFCIVWRILNFERYIVTMIIWSTQIQLYVCPYIHAIIFFWLMWNFTRGFVLLFYIQNQIINSIELAFWNKQENKSNHYLAIGGCFLFCIVCRILISDIRMDSLIRNRNNNSLHLLW